MSNSTPNWALNYDPAPAEWNLWWAKKQDWSTVLDQLIAQGGAPSFTGPVTLSGPLTLSYSGGTALTVSTATTALGGPLTVTGAATFQSTVGVTGVATFGGTPNGAGITALFASPLGIGTTMPAVGNFTTISATGLISPASSIGIAGTATNDSPAAGSIGEVISSTITTGAAVTLTTSGNSYNVTSISLTAGDWDVWGDVVFKPAGSTTIAGLQAGINTSTGSLTGSNPYGAIGATLTTGTLQTLFPGVAQAKVSSTTPYYLVALASFGTSTMSAYGSIFARRRR